MLKYHESGGRVGDIVASTDNESIIKNVYRDELTVTYDPPKPAKTIPTKQDLYNADLFSFGSMIGSITNKGTNAYAVLPLLEAEYGEDSDEVKLIISRLQQCCVAQSKQIDRAKLGRPVKGIPDVWIRRQRIQPDDDDETREHKELLNRCLIDKRPYFFKYRYSDSKREHDSYKKSRDAVCKSLFDLSIDELMAAPRKTSEQRDWLRNYHEFAPLVESDSPMNLLCKYIEQIDFQILKKFRDGKDFDATVYIDDDVEDWEQYYYDVIKCYSRHLKNKVRSGVFAGDEFSEEKIIAKLKEELSFICSNTVAVTNCMVKYLLIDNPRKDIEILWQCFGGQLVQAARKKNAHPITFPFPCDTGEIEYLGERYTNMEVSGY